MSGTIAPYSPADTATAAAWLDYVAAAYATAGTVADCDAAARETVDKLQRRGLISGGAAALILEALDLSPLDFA